MPIRAVALDVDGVLTDGTFTWSAGGEEMKTFSFRDVMGISLASRRGIVFALISGETGPLIERYAKKMGITFVWQGCRDKALALREFSQAAGVPPGEICFVGDDVNDLPAMALAGSSAAPSDAHPGVLAAVDYVSPCGGGRGAVRDVLEHHALCDAPQLRG